MQFQALSNQPDGSKMNSHNLALVFAPNLLKVSPFERFSFDHLLLAGSAAS